MVVFARMTCISGQLKLQSLKVGRNLLWPSLCRLLVWTSTSCWDQPGERERERENSGCAQPDGHAWPKPGCLINLSGKNCFTWDSTSTRQRFLVLESCASLTLQLSCRSVQGIFGLKRFGIWQGIVVLWRTVCPRPLPSAWAQWSTSPSSLHHLAVLQCVPENRIWLCLSVGNLQNFLILQWNSIPPWSTSKLPPIPELLPLAQ